MSKRWLATKMPKLIKGRAELRSLHRSQVSLYPDSGVRHVSASGVTSPRIKRNDAAMQALIDAALNEQSTIKE